MYADILRCYIHTRAHMHTYVRTYHILKFKISCLYVYIKSHK